VVTGRISAAVVSAIAMAGFLTSESVRAQTDLTGYWAPIMHEDAILRTAGPSLRDYSGLPINDAARAIADVWNPEDNYKPENQCEMHGAAYIMRSPLRFDLSYDDADTISIKIELEMGRERKIYLDGRAREPGPATDMGHSVGRWDGDTLTVATTNMRQKYIRRNGVPNSEEAVMTEHFVRHGDLLTIISIIEDPVFLTAPLVRSVSFNRLDQEFKWIRFPCEVIEWPGGLPGAG
jgi:hypothetical protein